MDAAADDGPCRDVPIGQEITRHLSRGQNLPRASPSIFEVPDDAEGNFEPRHRFFIG